MSKNYYDFVDYLKKNPERLNELRAFHGWEDCGVEGNAVHYRTTPIFDHSRWEVATKEDITKVIKESEIINKDIE